MVYVCCRHAQDVRELYEKKLERANNLYMELTSCMLQLEKRERELSKSAPKLSCSICVVLSSSPQLGTHWGTPTDASVVMTAHWLLLLAMLSINYSYWPVHSLKLSIHSVSNMGIFKQAEYRVNIT